MAYSGTGEDLKASNYGYVYESRAIKYNTPFNLFDGDRSTLWQSYSDLYEEYTDENGDKHYPYKIDNLYYNAKAPDLPYTIVIQPGESRSIDLDGVYMAFGFIHCIAFQDFLQISIQFQRHRFGIQSEGYGSLQHYPVPSIPVHPRGSIR